MHGEKSGMKSNKAGEVEEELGFEGGRIAVDVWIPYELSAKAQGGKGGGHIVILGNRKPGRGKDGSKPCFGSITDMFKEELDQVKGLMGGERSRRFFKEQNL